MARRRRQLGAADQEHLEQAEHHLKEAYKHAAKINRAARDGDCTRVWQEIMNTYGETRSAQAHLNSTTPRYERAGRVKQAQNNAMGLMNRVTTSIESVGWQCTRKAAGLGQPTRRRLRRRRHDPRLHRRFRRR